MKESISNGLFTEFTADQMVFFELNTATNFSFLSGASHPAELVSQAAKLNYAGIAIADECSLASIVRAHVEAKKQSLKLLVASRIKFENKQGRPIELILLCPCREAYAELSSLITQARRRVKKGKYLALLKDIDQLVDRCLAIWLPINDLQESSNQIRLIQDLFPDRLWIGYHRHLLSDDFELYLQCIQLARTFNLPVVAQNQVLMHVKQRLKLQHCLTAIKHNQTIQSLGKCLVINAERHLRTLDQLTNLYPKSLLDETIKIAELCHFSLDELRYEYPDEVLPSNLPPSVYLRQLVFDGAKIRWPEGMEKKVEQQIEYELKVIKKLTFEHYFLTVYDIVYFAKSNGILCQGRGSAANSAVCYCLFITEVDPQQSDLLFERFISEERDEPPDIDVDFEHQRREEVIQYIYKKYSRSRAALAATVITYRMKSAIRDVGKALGIDQPILEHLNQSFAWWDKPESLQKYFLALNLSKNNLTSKNYRFRKNNLANHFYELVMSILNFPRHLSQHVGGFIITRRPMSTLVPVENASMPDRTVIQWDKYDIEALGLLKIDVLGLGMLTMIRKCLEITASYSSVSKLSDIEKEDPDTYKMICEADTIGVFQIESRAQMSMLPRLRPTYFYDLVIQIAIVRPGPIQGNMVHPFLKRRNKEEAVSYPNDEIKKVLERTLGVPIFQEQVIKLAMVAAGFSGGQSDQLRRAMASWGRNGDLHQFRDKLVNGMLERGHSQEFAERIFEQIKGFGSYGFPESHSASFAILAYFSAWLKCHHGAAFYCALLNSQPMGFYSPSQLVQDASRHKINVLPIDIDFSLWESTVINRIDSKQNKTQTPSTPPTSIRLGMHLIKGFNLNAATRLIKVRQEKTFSNIKDLVFRAQLNSYEKDALVRANTLHRLAKHRHQAQWQSLGIEDNKPLLKELDSCPLTDSDSDSEQVIRSPSIIEDMIADYNTTGLTLNKHPIAILREQNLLKGCKSAIHLNKLRHGQFVKVAGVVSGRQRPQTAAGILFVTLEDETGNMNIVVWNRTLETFRKQILTSHLLLIKGKVEREKSVIHIVAGHIQDISYQLQDFARASRDFH
ncbi:MAG: error-prone DNA polymerase [Kangiellaceae bacterium]|nr:error-prone DNA polymerase [Kangiellaceae bacterium]